MNGSYVFKTKHRNLDHVKDYAENLKCEIWAFMDKYKVKHDGIKESMNELLDLLDELGEEENE